VLFLKSLGRISRKLVCWVFRKEKKVPIKYYSCDRDIRKIRFTP
jgi:hypothetical protein